MIVAAEVATASERGPGHVRHQTPSEDAVDWMQAGGQRLVVAAAVADGHGDRRCLRSADGARFAVRAALGTAVEVGGDTVVDFAADSPAGTGADAVADEAAVGLRRLTEMTVRRWRELVDADLARRPMPAADLDSIEVVGARAAVNANPRLLYGTTLILGVVTRDRVVVVQIGDGDAVAVWSDGCAHRLLDPDPTQGSGTTTSLSQTDAVQVARLRCLERAEVPSLLILASDGIGDAYPDDDALLRVGRELVARTATDGRAAAVADLAGWVSAAAANSGDDASAAVIWVETDRGRA